MGQLSSKLEWTTSRAEKELPRSSLKSNLGRVSNQCVVYVGVGGTLGK